MTMKGCVQWDPVCGLERSHVLIRPKFVIGFGVQK